MSTSTPWDSGIRWARRTRTTCPLPRDCGMPRFPANMSSIARRGLLAGGTRGETGAMQRGADRQHVHTIPVFAPFVDWTLRAVQDSFHGHESPVIVEIDIQRAIALGVLFIRNAGGVVLTRGIALGDGMWGLPPSCFNNFWALPGLHVPAVPFGPSLPSSLRPPCGIPVLPCPTSCLLVYRIRPWISHQAT